MCLKLNYFKDKTIKNFVNLLLFDEIQFLLIKTLFYNMYDISTLCIIFEADE